MINIKVEIIGGGDFTMEVSRVPCVGEYVEYNGACHEVIAVFHCQNGESNVAIIRVK